jgi:hypothetical protein
MFFNKNLTWYERQQKRKSSRFFQLFNHSFRFRLIIACFLSLIFISLIDRFDSCRTKNYSEDCLTVDFWDVISTDNVEAFSIVAAALMYILEAGK